MENTVARLLLLKAQLYALLATLGGLLLIISLAVLWQAEPSAVAGAVPIDAGGVTRSVRNSPQLAAGKALFAANCAACHNKNMIDDLTGPALGQAEKYWAAYPRQDLYDWIRNSQEMIHVRRHPRALELWKKWGPTQMNSFSSLSDEQIEQLLAYIRG